MDIRTDAAVSRIIVQDNRVVAVELADGQRIESDLICSTIDPVQTGLQLIGQRYLSAAFSQSLSRIRTRGTTAFLELALSSHPVDTAGQPIDALRICRPLDDTEKAFDPVKYDAMSEEPLVDVRVFGAQDGVNCPDGHAVMSVMIHYAPYALSGGWTRRRPQNADGTSHGPTQRGLSWSERHNRRTPPYESKISPIPTG